MKKILIIICVIAMTILAGCGDSESSSSYSSIAAGFKGGDNSVNIEYEENMPPEKVRDNGVQSFNIRLKLLNEGEYDIPEGGGDIKLTGFSANEFGTEPQNLIKPLPALNGYTKRNGDLIEPTSRYVMFNNFKYNNDLKGASEIQKRIYAFLCYNYETDAVGELCIKPNTYNNNDDAITQTCEIEGEKQIQHSSAPVGVENLKEMVLGQNKIQFQFDIVKKDSSVNIYEPNSLNECKINGKDLSNYDSDLKKNKVQFEVTGVEIDNLDINCNNAGNSDTVNIGDSKKITVLCDVDVSGEVEREAPININLKYDVVSRKETSITIYNNNNS